MSRLCHVLNVCRSTGGCFCPSTVSFCRLLWLWVFFHHFVSFWLKTVFFFFLCQWLVSSIVHWEWFLSKSKHILRTHSFILFFPVSLTKIENCSSIWPFWPTYYFSDGQWLKKQRLKAPGVSERCLVRMVINMQYCTVLPCKINSSHPKTWSICFSASGMSVWETQHISPPSLLLSASFWTTTEEESS